jgi:hypothetical protein
MAVRPRAVLVTLSGVPRASDNRHLTKRLSHGPLDSSVFLLIPVPYLYILVYSSSRSGIQTRYQCQGLQGRNQGSDIHIFVLIYRLHWTLPLFQLRVKGAHQLYPLLIVAMGIATSSRLSTVGAAGSRAGNDSTLPG